jgi:hypothetical protein
MKQNYIGLTHRGLSYDVEVTEQGARYWINATAEWSSTYYTDFLAASKGAETRIEAIIKEAYGKKA